MTLPAAGRLFLAATALVLVAACTPSAEPGAPLSSAAPSTSEPVSPTPTARGLTEANLITADDLPALPGGVTLEVWSDNARSVDEASVCQGPLAELGASQVLTRSFTERSPDSQGDPAEAEPTTYTQALQFADAAAATAARTTYEGWITDCTDTLENSSTWTLIRGVDEVEWASVTLSTGSGRFTQVPLYRAKDDSSDEGYFETVGLTQVEDRLMVTVDLVYGNEKHTSHDEGGDDDTGLPEDFQFALIRAAAERLA